MCLWTLNYMHLPFAVVYLILLCQNFKFLFCSQLLLFLLLIASKTKKKKGKKTHLNHSKDWKAPFILKWSQILRVPVTCPDFPYYSFSNQHIIFAILMSQHGSSYISDLSVLHIPYCGLCPQLGVFAKFWEILGGGAQQPLVTGGMLMEEMMWPQASTSLFASWLSQGEWPSFALHLHLRPWSKPPKCEPK